MSFSLPHNSSVVTNLDLRRVLCGMWSCSSSELGLWGTWGVALDPDMMMIGQPSQVEPGPDALISFRGTTAVMFGGILQSQVETCEPIEVTN